MENNNAPLLEMRSIKKDFFGNQVLTDISFTLREGEVLGLVGDTSKIDIELLESMDIIESVKRISDPFKGVNRKFHPDDTIVSIGDIKFGGGNFQFIAGPCSVESPEQILEIARSVKASGATLLRGGAFKPRTSPYDFQGLKQDGLQIMRDVKAEFNINGI